jgi:hypothetical protein
MAFESTRLSHQLRVRPPRQIEIVINLLARREVLHPSTFWQIFSGSVMFMSRFLVSRTGISGRRRATSRSQGRRPLRVSMAWKPC